MNIWHTLKSILLVLVLLLVPVLTLVSCITSSAADVIVYQKYPSEIVPTDEYSVSVYHNGKKDNLVSYNLARGKGIVANDNHRRFAEFAFSGGKVVVEVTSNKFDLEKATVIPKEIGEKAYFENGKLNIPVDKPCIIYVEEGDDSFSGIAIFADAPEKDVPNENDKNVIYMKAGFNKVDGDKLILHDNETLYLAPGAVLNAKVVICGNNVTIKGRGIIRDPFIEKTLENFSLIFVQSGVENITMNDAKIGDSLLYCIVLNGVKNVRLNNVKVMANLENTDGLTCWKTTRNVVADHCFFYVADNVFAVSGGDSNDITINNTIACTNSAIFSPANNIGDNVVFKNIDVIDYARAFTDDPAMMINLYDTFLVRTDKHIDGIYLDDIDASYTHRQKKVFNAGNQGMGEKNIYWKNVKIGSVPLIGFNILGDGGYHIVLDNVTYGDHKISGDDNSRIKDNGAKLSDFVYKREEIPLKVFINGNKVKLDSEPFLKNDETMVPVTAIAKIFGAAVKWSKESKKADIELENICVEFLQDSMTAKVNGANMPFDVVPIVRNDSLYVPLRFLSKVFNADIKYNDVSNGVLIDYITVPKVVKTIAKGTNLLKNGNFEASKINDSSSWYPLYDAAISLTKAEEYKGGQYAHISSRRYYGAGIAQDITENLNAAKKGRYKISLSSKAFNDDAVGSEFSAIIKLRTKKNRDYKYYNISFKMNKSWTKAEGTVDFDFDDILTNAVFYICGTEGRLVGNRGEFEIDDCELIKVD